MFLMNPGMTACSCDQDRLAITLGAEDGTAADTGSMTVNDQ
jgi:hypothetical protein